MPVPNSDGIGASVFRPSHLVERRLVELEGEIDAFLLLPELLADLAILRQILGFLLVLRAEVVDRLHVAGKLRGARNRLVAFDAIPAGQAVIELVVERRYLLVLRLRDIAEILDAAADRPLGVGVLLQIFIVAEFALALQIVALRTSELGRAGRDRGQQRRAAAFCVLAAQNVKDPLMRQHVDGAAGQIGVHLVDEAMGDMVDDLLARTGFLAVAIKNVLRGNSEILHSLDLCLGVSVGSRSGDAVDRLVDHLADARIRCDQRAARLIEQLLDISRCLAGGIETRKRMGAVGLLAELDEEFLGALDASLSIGAFEIADLAIDTHLLKRVLDPRLQSGTVFLRVACGVARIDRGAVRERSDLCALLATGGEGNIDELILCLPGDRVIVLLVAEAGDASELIVGLAVGLPLLLLHVAHLIECLHEDRVVRCPLGHGADEIAHLTHVELLVVVLVRAELRRSEAF